MAAVNSLRKKGRGGQTLPRRQSVYADMIERAPEPLPPPPKVRSTDKSKVESLMKRRYSMRAPALSVQALETFPSELRVKAKTVETNGVPKVIIFQGVVKIYRANKGKLMTLL